MLFLEQQYLIYIFQNTRDERNVSFNIQNCDQFFILTFPDLTFSAHRGPYCGIPRATSNHANTVGALHRSMGTDAASLSKRSFSA